MSDGPHITGAGGIPSAEAFGGATVFAVPASASASVGVPSVHTSSAERGGTVRRTTTWATSYRVERGARELSTEQESFRTFVVMCLMLIATDDWGWSAVDASMFGLGVWATLGELLRRVS